MKLKLVLLLALGCARATLHAHDPPAISANATNQFRVSGMHCDGCARGIASELKRVPGVLSAEVTFRTKLAIVAYDTNRVSAAGLTKTISDAGYAAKLVQSRKSRRP
jgi:mercuric ion binding protein